MSLGRNMTVGHLPTSPCRIIEVLPEPTRTGYSCIQTKKRIVRHGYVGRVMSDGPALLYIGPIDVGPYGHYVGQVTLYHAMTLSGVNPPTVVPEADVILQCWLEYLGSFLQ